jgi:uncharacterized repeat protein (TIGR03847 family)
VGSSFHFDAVEQFDAVTVGEPGQRVFFIRVVAQGETAYLRLEKQQVAALAVHLQQMLVDLPDTEPAVQVAEPVGAAEAPESAWIVGALGAAYDKNEDRILVVAEELIETDEDDEPILDEEGPGMLTVRLTRAQANGFAQVAETVVGAGRPPCPWCGRPLDATGHNCARMN